MMPIRTAQQKKLEGYQDALIDNGLKVQEEYKVLMPNNVLKARDLLAKKKLDLMP